MKRKEKKEVLRIDVYFFVSVITNENLYYVFIRCVCSPLLPPAD